MGHSGSTGDPEVPSGDSCPLQVRWVTLAISANHESSLTNVPNSQRQGDNLSPLMKEDTHLGNQRGKVVGSYNPIGAGIPIEVSACIGMCVQQASAVPGYIGS